LVSFKGVQTPPIMTSLGKSVLYCLWKTAPTHVLLLGTVLTISSQKMNDLLFAQHSANIFISYQLAI